MNSIFYELLGLVLNKLRNNKKIRTILFLISLWSIILLFIGFSLSRYFVHEIEILLKEFGPPTIVVLIGAVMVVLLSYTDFEASSNPLDIELHALQLERDEIRKRLNESRNEEIKKEENVFDTIQLSLNQITEYYTINKSQARNSFTLSVFAIISGLVTLTVGIWIFYLKEEPNIDMTIITGISSVLMEFIGGAYFYLYNKSLKQLNFFYEKLVKMQDTMLAIQLTESLQEEKEVEMKERLIIELMSRSNEVSQPNKD